MQDRYAGDVGDFGKFSLLKSLFDRASDCLGVVWYLFPDETHNDDGKYTKYIEKQEFQSCDPDLINKLSNVLSGERSVYALENNNILKTNTVYYSGKLDFQLIYLTQKKSDIETRLSKRQEWLKNAIKTVKLCNIVFLDPDNGLEINSCKKMSLMKSGKYAYYSEIKKLFEGKDACVIYHHLNRNKKHKEQIESRVKDLREKIDSTGKIFALRYKPYSPRVYFVISKKPIEKQLKNKIQRFMNGPCCKFWDNYFEG
jgi:hypothetical protein